VSGAAEDAARSAQRRTRDSTHPAAMINSAAHNRGAASSVDCHSDWALSAISSSASGPGGTTGVITTSR
jgi:hypothetical protein